MEEGGLRRGVLNNSLFQVPQRSSQINFPSSCGLYIFRADTAHLWRQEAVKVLHPTAVRWINGLGGFPWGVGGRKQLAEHFPSLSYITELLLANTDIIYISIVISNSADPKLKIQACFSQMFTNVNNLWFQSTSKTHVSTYKLLFLVPRAQCLCLL